MTNADPESFLEARYADAMRRASGETAVESDLPQPVKSCLDTLIRHSENRTGVYTVLFSSVAYKCLHPDQDVRRHQSQIPGGYSGRTFDAHHATPFLRRHQFPAMKESGWLTRSLEQAAPYTLDFNGKITPKELKAAFLNTLDAIEVQGTNAEAVLDYLLEALIIQRDAHGISLAKPQNLTILGITELLDRHFRFRYTGKGASRLPVLALYAAYQCLLTECRRYEQKRLLPLESHTSADQRSGRMGDIDVVCSDGTPFEAVEVKFDISVDHEIVEAAKAKILTSKVSRYYILSTVETKEEDREAIARDIQQIKNVHGCQLVVNGVMPSLKYYLRLLSDTSAFVEGYVNLLASDEALLFEHRSAWNELVSNM